MNWRRKFRKPIRSKRLGRTFATLHEARAFMLSLGESQPHYLSGRQWENAFEHLEAAAKGGSVKVAREAFCNALFLTFLDIAE